MVWDGLCNFDVNLLIMKRYMIYFLLIFQFSLLAQEGEKDWINLMGLTKDNLWKTEDWHQQENRVFHNRDGIVLYLDSMEGAWYVSEVYYIFDADKGGIPVFDHHALPQNFVFPRFDVQAEDSFDQVKRNLMNEGIALLPPEVLGVSPFKLKFFSRSFENIFDILDPKGRQIPYPGYSILLVFDENAPHTLLYIAVKGRDREEFIPGP